MTMPMSDTRRIQLAPPGFPMVALVISNSLFPTSDAQPVTWVVSKPHPLVPEANVIRMFVGQHGVEIYSVSQDGRNGMRDIVPLSTIRLIQETMPLDIFVEELEYSERSDDDPSDSDAGVVDDEAEIESAATEPPSNGQAVP
jgi:hypothetical protein